MFRRPEGREGGVGSLGECGTRGRQGQRGPSLPLLYHTFFCVPNSSQGPSGLPGSTGQKVTGLDLKGWVAERSVGPADMRRELTSGTELAEPANTPVIPPCPNSHQDLEGNPTGPMVSGLAGLGVLPVVYPPVGMRPFNLRGSRGLGLEGNCLSPRWSCHGSSRSFPQPQSLCLYLFQGQKGERGDGGIKGSMGKPGRDVCMAPSPSPHNPTSLSLGVWNAGV